MSVVKQIQLAELNAKNLRTLLKGSEDVVVYDGAEPLARLLPIGVELGRRKDFFVHYPHDPQECFGTCWRHNGSAETEQPTPQAAPEPELATAGA